MWIVLLLLAVIIQPDTANGNTLSCRPPWIKLRRACYKFVKAKETWINAKMHCNSEGGDLVSIVTFSEKRRILRRLMSEITSPDHQYWWVGLGLIRSRGQWVWQDGTPLDIRIVNWMPGEPNNVRNDHCAEMSYKAMLNDRHCSDRRPFICERVPITPPPSKSTTPIPVTTTTTVTTVATTTTTELPTTTTSQKSTDQPTTIRAIETTEKETTIGDVTVSSKDKEKSLTDITTLNDVPTNKISTSSMTDKTTVVMFHHSSSAKMSSTVSRSHVTTVLPHRRTNHCPSVMAYDILWLKASKGETVSRPCKNGNGYAIWVCGTDPVEWLGEPDLSKCASETFAELVASVNKLTQERKVVSPEVAAEIATKLTEKTKVVKQDISSADIAVSTDILKKASKAKPENKEQASKLIKTFASAGSNIMKQAKSSPVIMKEDKRRSASRLLETIENAIQSVVESIEEPAVIQRKEEKLSLTVQVVNASLSSKITYDDTESQNEFSIPILRDFSKDGLAKVVFVTYYDIGDMLPVGEATSGAGTLQGGDKSAGKTELKVASNVISASIGLQETVKLPEPVNFTIRLKEKEKFAVPLCSFWDFTQGEYGAWSQEGCHHTGSNTTHVSCQCNHLTNFAILLDVTGVEMMYSHSVLLQYITFVGCIISIVSLFTSWLTFQCLGSLQNERNSIHKNLVFCLFAAEIIFLVGISRTEQKVACAAIALLLHFFFLSAFTWMLMEGIHITVMLIQVFDAARSRLKYYYLFAYGVPVAIVAATATIDFTAYGTRQFCWLTTDRWFIWSFAGPVAAVLLVNACVLGYSLSMVCRHSEYVFSSDRTGSSNFRAWIQGALAIEVLLGLTWVFGYMYINKETIAMAYIFTALNSLQGLFIFVFHCLLNKKVRNEYKKLVHLSKKAQSSTKSSSSIKKQTGSASYELYVPANS